MWQPASPLRDTLLTQRFANTVAFRIYDLGNTGSIDRSEVCPGDPALTTSRLTDTTAQVRTLLLATLREDAVLQQLPDATLERIIDQTFAAASAEGALSAEHSIGPGEWVAFCQRSPSILNNMTLPVLRDLTTVCGGAGVVGCERVVGPGPVLRA